MKKQNVFFIENRPISFGISSDILRRAQKIEKKNRPLCFKVQSSSNIWTLKRFYLTVHSSAIFQADNLIRALLLFIQTDYSRALLMKIPKPWSFFIIDLICNFTTLCLGFFRDTFAIFQCGQPNRGPDSFSTNYINSANAVFTLHTGAKYLGFFSFHSLKTREKYISFAQFIYFLREVCLLFNFWMIEFTIVFFVT